MFPSSKFETAQFTANSTLPVFKAVVWPFHQLISSYHGTMSPFHLAEKLIVPVWQVYGIITSNSVFVQLLITSQLTDTFIVEGVGIDHTRCSLERTPTYFNLIFSLKRWCWEQNKTSGHSRSRMWLTFAWWVVHRSDKSNRIPHCLVFWSLLPWP